jgi:hypothetical protein
VNSTYNLQTCLNFSGLSPFGGGGELKAIDGITPKVSPKSNVAGASKKFASGLNDICQGCS